MCMSKIRSKDTKPEKVVRKILTKLGFRYRLHNAKLPGKPDIVISKVKTMIFINGCFWHQHEGCSRQAVPKANIKYWEEKLQRNVEKQKKDIKALENDDWKVIVVWECETRKEKSLTEKLQKIL